jgi:hypothetical protein
MIPCPVERPTLNVRSMVNAIRLYRHCQLSICVFILSVYTDMYSYSKELECVDLAGRKKKAN